MAKLQSTPLYIAYLMMQELNGVGNIYPETLEQCYQSTCHKYQIIKDEHKKEVIDRVISALKGEEYKDTTLESIPVAYRNKNFEIAQRLGYSIMEGNECIELYNKQSKVDEFNGHMELNSFLQIIETSR
jgi:transcriptional antiterminator